MQKYFIGQIIEGKNIFERAKTKIIYELVLFAVVLTTIIGIYTSVLGHTLVSIRAFVSLILMFGMLFAAKWARSMMPLIHVLILATIFTIFTNIFIVFQQVDYSTIALFFVSTMFGFYFLKTGWAIFYAIIQMIALVLVMYLNIIETYWTSIEPQAFSPSEQALAFVIVGILVAYLLLQFHKANEQFSEHLTESNRTLKKARDSAEELSKLKSTFLANMSHEIRTPLNGIIGLAELIEDKTADDEVKQMVEMQIKSSNRLLDTITSILRLSKFEAERKSIDLFPVQINDLVISCVELLEPLASKKGIGLNYKHSEEDILCKATKDILIQILNNIIGNGIKFTEEGSVEVETLYSDHMAVIKVKDTGIGIGEEFLPKIFNSFEQESTGFSRSYEGSGLGLSISQKYIELLGGNLEVESTKGVGTVFTIEIPSIPTA